MDAWAVWTGIGSPVPWKFGIGGPAISTSQWDMRGRKDQGSVPAGPRAVVGAPALAVVTMGEAILWARRFGPADGYRRQLRYQRGPSIRETEV